MKGRLVLSIITIILADEKTLLGDLCAYRDILCLGYQR